MVSPKQIIGIIANMQYIGNFSAGPSSESGPEQQAISPDNSNDSYLRNFRNINIASQTTSMYSTEHTGHSVASKGKQTIVQILTMKVFINEQLV